MAMKSNNVFLPFSKDSNTKHKSYSPPMSPGSIFSDFLKCTALGISLTKSCIFRMIVFSFPIISSTEMKLLRPTVERVAAKRGDKCEILIENDRYLRALLIDATSSEKSIAEFYFTPNDTTVQFRIGSVVTNAGNPLLRGSSLRNIDRGEMIRKELRYLKLPVLRNRKRSLFFVESDLDQFGPGSASLGPPAEMKSGEINGRLSDNVDPRLKIDTVQQFPFLK